MVSEVAEVQKEEERSSWGTWKEDGRAEEAAMGLDCQRGRETGSQELVMTNSRAFTEKAESTERPTRVDH